MTRTNYLLFTILVLFLLGCGENSKSYVQDAGDTSAETDATDVTDMSDSSTEPDVADVSDSTTEPDIADVSDATPGIELGPPPEPVICPDASDESPDFMVAPFLQMALPDSIWIVWETSSADESRIDWGPSEALGFTVCGTAADGVDGSRIHEAQLTELEPNTRYYYRAQTGTRQSEIYDFITPPLAEAEQSFRFVAMSDIQFDWSHPTKYQEIVEEGVIAYMAETYGPDLPAELHLALIPGDLVDDGLVYSQWATDFFGPGEALMAHIPFYPVPGNHENDSDYFFDYFHLPENGSPDYLEHWWTHDYSNVRFIGLDSNSGYRIEEQLNWLDGVLAESCDAPAIDFVFAQLHHPHKSELWIAGETGFTGDVIERLENFSTDCGKPSIHFFGHTHGYSRGQSRDHNHLWVNVATAGGNIDYWGEYEQRDYPEFTVSQDEYGFVILEVEAGDDPSFVLRRISRGDGDVVLDNQIRDSVTVRRYNEGPATPAGLSPGGSLGCTFSVTLEASAYSDPEGDLQGASHWQVSPDCESFASLAFESWRQHENWYFEVDTQAGDDLSNEIVTGLETGQSYCWRVRYRDRSQGWSSWSAPQNFMLLASNQTGNLLLNPGAEDNTDHWTLTEGYLESLTDGECNGVAPFAGDRYFVVGGICNSASYGEAYQRVAIPQDQLAAVEAGGAVVSFGGYLGNYSGPDEPSIKVVFYDEDLVSIGETEPMTVEKMEWSLFFTSTWDYIRIVEPIPTETRSIDLVIMGTRYAGTDNDSYFDDLELSVQHCDGN